MSRRCSLSGSLRRVSGAADTGSASDLAPPPREATPLEPLDGWLTIHVLEAEKLQHPGPDEAVKPPYVRITCAGQSYNTQIAVGSVLHLWKDAHHTFEVTTPAVATVEVYRHLSNDSTADPIKIGETSVSVEKKRDCGAKWLDIYRDSDPDSSCGRLRLSWSFEVLPDTAKMFKRVSHPHFVGEKVGEQPHDEHHPRRKLSDFHRPVSGKSDGGRTVGRSPRRASHAPNNSGGAEPSGARLLKVRLEVIRANDFQAPEEWDSFQPFVEISHCGTVLGTSRVEKGDTTSPFYNCVVELTATVDELGGIAGPGVLLTVWHLNEPAAGEERRVFASCIFALAPTLAAARDTQGKPAVHQVTLGPAAGEAGGGGGVPEAGFGSLDVRVQYHLESCVSPKAKRARQSVTEAFPADTEEREIIDSKRWRSTLKCDGTIALGYVVERDGSIDLVPKESVYAWNAMFNEPRFRKGLEQVMVEGYLEAILGHVPPAPAVRVIRNAANSRSNSNAGAQAVPLPQSTMDTVLTRAWCTTRVQPVLEMLRLCAEAYLRAQSEGGRKSLKKLFPLNTEDVLQKRVALTEQYAVRLGRARGSAEVKEALQAVWESVTADNISNDDDSEMEKARYRAVVQHTLCFFIPGLSHDLAKTLAEREWDTVGRLGRDESGSVLLFDERFKLIVLQLACIWCETQTNFEVTQYLESFQEHMLDSVKRLAHKIGRASEAGTRRGSGPPRRQSTARRQSSAGLRNRSKSQPHPVQQEELKTDTVDSSSFAANPEPHPEENGGSRPSSSARRRRTSSVKRTSIVLASSVKLSGSRRSSRPKKTPFEMAEDKVNKAFEMEDMSWDVLAAWAKEVFGGFGERALDLLGMSAKEVHKLMLRLYSDAFSAKHNKIQGDLVKAVVEFFNDIRPSAEEERDSHSEILRNDLEMARSKYRAGVKCSDGQFDRILEYADVPTLLRCQALNPYCRNLVSDVIELRKHKLYPLPESLTPRALQEVFSESHCRELAHQCGTGKLKNPGKLSQTVAEMACIILGYETGGYWAKFRELICRKDAWSLFAGFDPTHFTKQRFLDCHALKQQSDNGVDRQGRQMPREMLGVSWFTMTEETVAQQGTEELTSLYRWVRLIMSFYSRHSGRTPSVMEQFCWMESVKVYVFWD